MTSQLNPARQRNTVSSDHLADGRDALRPEQSSDGRQVIPFLLDNCGQNWIPANLCQALNQRGHHSQVWELPPDGGETLAEALAATLVQPAGDGLCLLTTLSAAILHACRFDHVVLLVPANLDAVLSAYQRIKLLSRPVAPDIGIVVVGPRDQHAAWRYFRKLAVATLRYLDVPLLNLGYLPHEVTPHSGASDQHRGNFIVRISERLLRSEFYSRYQCEGTARQARPE